MGDWLIITFKVAVLPLLTLKNSAVCYWLIRYLSPHWFLPKYLHYSINWQIQAWNTVTLIKSSKVCVMISAFLFSTTESSELQTKLSSNFNLCMQQCTSLWIIYYLRKTVIMWRDNTNPLWFLSRQVLFRKLQSSLFLAPGIQLMAARASWFELCAACHWTNDSLSNKLKISMWGLAFLCHCCWGCLLCLLQWSVWLQVRGFCERDWLAGCLVRWLATAEPTQNLVQKRLALWSFSTQRNCSIHFWFS